MAKKDLLVLVIALVCGFASFVLILSFLSDAGRPKNSIVIAAVDIEAGKELTKSDLTYSGTLELEDKTDYFLQIDDAVGKIILTDVNSGDSIVRSNTKIKEVIVEVTKEVIKEPEIIEEEVITELPVPPGNTGLLVKKHNFANLDDNIQIGQYMDMIQMKELGDTKVPVTITHNAKILRVDRAAFNNSVQNVFVGIEPDDMVDVLSAIDLGKLTVAVHDQPREVTEKTVHEVEIIKGAKKPYSVKFDLKSDDYYEKK